VPKNVKIAVVRSDLEERTLGPVPLIEHFPDRVFMPVKLKPKRPLVSFAGRIALHVDSHLLRRDRNAWAI
jgi:hypothetical protein